MANRNRTVPGAAFSSLPTLVVLAAIVLSTGLNAKGTPCETALVSVDTSDGGLHRRVCDVVATAIPVLNDCQLKLTNPIIVSFADKLGTSDGACVGLYHPGKDRIELLKPVAFVEAHRGTDFWRSVPISEHYDAIIVHELVHALVDQTALAKRACSADEEYIAYTMQVGSLSDASRSALIAETGASQPISVEEINPLILGLSPPAFAARSWLHFSQPENGCDFIGKLLRGEMTFWTYPE